MKFELREMVQLAIRTVASPRETATMILSLGIPRAALWPAMALVVTISIMLAIVNELLVPMLVDGPRITPMVLGLLQFSVLMITVTSIFWIGRALGGTGRFDEALLLVIWLQFIMVCLQVVQTASLLIAPGIATLIGVVGLVLFMYLLTHFVTVLHGFRSLSRVFMMILLSAFGLVMGLSILLALVGVNIPGAV